mmetsp:Transcript_6650/g.10064  ORF Transcript_6650/g.10064 Transcript_6650/m.10064 type:complete len:83 (-) Transcript_6650:184-432(-)
MVAPEYRLSIKHPYPAALDDCYNMLLWLKRLAKTLRIRSDESIVGGQSAGGALMAAIALKGRDLQGEINIALQMPIHPMIDH